MVIHAPEGLSDPEQALSWLKAGDFVVGPEWVKAHALCQLDEGDRDHDLVHALCHWIEGDLANRDYWYRRLAPWRRAGTIAAEWQAVRETVA